MVAAINGVVEEKWAWSSCRDAINGSRGWGYERGHTAVRVMNGAEQRDTNTSTFINQLYWQVASTATPLPQHVGPSCNTCPRGGPEAQPRCRQAGTAPLAPGRRGESWPHTSPGPWSSWGRRVEGLGWPPLPARGRLWLVALCFHVIEAQLFVLLKGALVALHAQLRVLFWGVHVLWGQGESSCTLLCPQAWAQRRL